MGTSDEVETERGRGPGGSYVGRVGTRRLVRQRRRTFLASGGQFQFKSTVGETFRKGVWSGLNRETYTPRTEYGEGIVQTQGRDRPSSRPDREDDLKFKKPKEKKKRNSVSH